MTNARTFCSSARVAPLLGKSGGTWEIFEKRKERRRKKKEKKKKKKNNKEEEKEEKNVTEKKIPSFRYLASILFLKYFRMLHVYDRY